MNEIRDKIYDELNVLHQPGYFDITESVVTIDGEFSYAELRQVIAILQRGLFPDSRALSEEQMRIAVRVLKRNLYASMTGVFLPADSRIEEALREALAECLKGAE